MGDDTCRPHEHYGRPCYRHHFTPRDTIMYCPFCTRRADSVRGDNVARKHQDRYGDW